MQTFYKWHEIFLRKIGSPHSTTPGCPRFVLPGESSESCCCFSVCHVSWAPPLLTRNCFFHLRNISTLRTLVSKVELKKIIHALISSPLDYCNSLFTCLSHKELHCLQVVQNSAARLLTHTSKRMHISPLLAALHWLPVPLRIHFQILVLTFRALPHTSVICWSFITQHVSVVQTMEWFSTVPMLLRFWSSRRPCCFNRLFSWMLELSNFILCLFVCTCGCVFCAFIYAFYLLWYFTVQYK